MYRKIIPDIVAATKIFTIKQNGRASEAAKLMAKKNIAAIIVVDGNGKISGIVTERDICQKIIAHDLDPATTAVRDIMTANPDTLSPEDSAGDALELMQNRQYRHLPVVQNGKCLAVVSIRDLYAAIKESLEEDIREAEAFIFGGRDEA